LTFVTILGLFGCNSSNEYAVLSETQKDQVADIVKRELQASIESQRLYESIKEEVVVLQKFIDEYKKEHPKEDCLIPFYISNMDVDEQPTDFPNRIAHAHLFNSEIPISIRIFPDFIENEVRNPDENDIDRRYIKSESADRAFEDMQYITTHYSRYGSLYMNVDLIEPEEDCMQIYGDVYIKIKDKPILLQDFLLERGSVSEEYKRKMAIEKLSKEDEDNNSGDIKK